MNYHRKVKTTNQNRVKLKLEWDGLTYAFDININLIQVLL